jgi:hypothetical protein
MILSTAKIDDQTIEVAFKVESISARFNVAQLKAQREAIQAQKDRDNAQRDKELAEVDEILAACTAQGVTEPTPAPAVVADPAVAEP